MYAPVTCQLSLVTYHLSPVTYHLAAHLSPIITLGA